MFRKYLIKSVTAATCWYTHMCVSVCVCDVQKPYAVITTTSIKVVFAKLKTLNCSCGWGGSLQIYYSKKSKKPTQFNFDTSQKLINCGLNYA